MRTTAITLPLFFFFVTASLVGPSIDSASADVVDTCRETDAMQVPLSLTETIENQGFDNDADWYQLSVPADTAVVIALEPSSDDLDLGFTFWETCAVPSARVDNGVEGASEREIFTNDRDTNVVIYLVVDGSITRNNIDGVRDYTLNVTTQSITTPFANMLSQNGLVTFRPNQRFQVTATIENVSVLPYNVDMFALLEIGGVFYFLPGATLTPDGYFDVEVTTTEAYRENLIGFIVPPDFPEFDATFFAAAVNRNTDEFSNIAFTPVRFRQLQP